MHCSSQKLDWCFIHQNLLNDWQNGPKSESFWYFFSFKNIDLREHFQCNLGFSWNFFSSNSVDMLKNLLTTESRRTGKLCGQWCRIWRTIFNSRVFWCFWYCKKKFRKIWFFVSTEMGLVIQLKSWKEEFSLNHKETC